jgi:hypothetical protein
MEPSRLSRITQGKHGAPLVLISRDQTEYSLNFDGGPLKALWNSIAQSPDIPREISGVQTGRSNLFIDLYSLPAVSEGSETRIEPKKGWLVRGKVNAFAPEKVYSIEDIAPDDQIMGNLYHLAESELVT